MSGVDPNAFRFALSMIEDGFVFENFALDFLAKIMGYDFIPAGGLRDRGIDGLEHTFHREGVLRTIYQLSIEKESKAKIRRSLRKLVDNKIDYNQFTYVTSRAVAGVDLLVDQLWGEYGVSVRIYDVNWFANHVNENEGAIRAYQVFIDSHLHEFSKPGRSYEVANLEGDPRLYVFLRQQWEENRKNLALDIVLADSLILYALEGTDPDKGILRTRADILEQIRKHVRFDPRLLHSLIDQRLKVLSAKPRRISHHKKADAYCLRLEERVAIENSNLNDVALYEAFRSDTASDIVAFFGPSGPSADDGLKLVEQLLHDLFYQQGLEFAECLVDDKSGKVFDKSLADLVSGVVDRQKGSKASGQVTKTALLATMRQMVYGGTQAQKRFLARLSTTYTMLFLLQCDPKLATYFGTLANKLTVYVCTSIMIPALSERFLEEQNRRYSNLLRSATQAGVKLVINEAILRELSAHFRMIKSRFEQVYRDCEEFYNDEIGILYVEEIMIRAYYYSRLRGQVQGFDEFIGYFVNAKMRNLDRDLVEWLKSEFGIEYVANSSVGVKLDPREVTSLQNELLKHKRHKEKALTDAEVVLTVRGLRELNNELGTGGIFGYRTWWLSSDIWTQMAVSRVLGSKVGDSCYMRPDFLYNYISLAPSRGEIKDAFDELFPTLLGVNMSVHMPEDATAVVHKFVGDFRQQNPARIKATLRELGENLRVDPTYRTRNKVSLFLDERRRTLESGN